MQLGRKRKLESLESLDSFETKHDTLLARTRASASTRRRITRTEPETKPKPKWLVDVQRDEPFMFPDQGFPIDMDRTPLEDFTAPDLAGWQVPNNLSSEIARDVFRRNLRYISRDEFVSLLQKAADKFEAKYGKQNYSMFVSGGDKCKSNYWVMELLLTQTSMARHLPLEVTGSKPLEDLVVLPDDGLFSGVQMSSALYHLQTMQEEDEQKKRYVVIVAVTTQRALDSIGNRAEIFYGDLLETAGDTAIKMGGKYRESAERGEFENSQPAVYFAHKVPDRASVPYAVQFFVGGCGFPQNQSAKLDEMLAGSEFQCPIPPYKQTPSCLDQRFFAGGVRNNNKAKDWWLGDEFTQDDFSKYMSSTPAKDEKREWKGLNDQLYKVGRSLANELTVPFVMVFSDPLGDACSSSFWATIQVASATNSYVSRPENVLSMQEAIDRSFDEMVVVFADDFMKTGQRMLAIVDEFLNETNTDPKQVVVAVAFASPQALELFHERLPGVKILAGTWTDEPSLASTNKAYASSPRCRAQGRVYPNFPRNQHKDVDK